MIIENQDLQELKQNIIEHILPVLREAVKTCSERHLISEDRGADDYSFGTDAWSLPRNQIKKLILSGTSPFQIGHGQGFSFVYDQFTIRHHRVGKTEKDSIWNSFPGHPIAAAQEQASQGWLFDSDPDFIDSQDIILAYMANPDDSLCAVYLTGIGEKENGKIKSWAFAEEVWRRDPGDTPQSVYRDTVPPEVTRKPVIKIIEKTDEKTNQQ